MPELAALEVLLAVARTGSLGAAARGAGTTQQAVSARISNLEALTGVPLVARGRRGSTLTPNGVLVAQWASRLLEVAAEVDEGLAGLRADRRSRLRVGASLTVAEHLLPGWLVALRQEAERRGEPAVDFVFAAANSDAVIAQVRAAEVDVGFIEGPRAPTGLSNRIVSRDELVVVVRPDHPWAKRRGELTPSELATVSLVTREPGSGTRETYDAALDRALGPGHAPPARPALELSTTVAVRGAVLAGAGPAVLSLLAVGEDLAAGRLRRIPVAGLDLGRALRAIWLGGSGRQPPAGPVRDLVALAARNAAGGSARGSAGRSE
jgi:DNA-binding transcriptional LysR family regulator